MKFLAYTSYAIMKKFADYMWKRARERVGFDVYTEEFMMCEHWTTTSSLFSGHHSRVL